MAWIKIDVDVDDFLCECSESEIGEVIDWLRNSKYEEELRIYPDEDFNSDLEDFLQDKSYTDKLTNDIILKLDQIRIQVDEDDLENILKILNKY